MRHHNNTISIALLACLALLPAIVTAQQTKTLAVRPKSGEFAGKTFYANSHALLIGISQYQFLPKEKWLEFAAQDAKEVRDVLIRSYGFPPENVIVLLNEQATRRNIEDALASLADEGRVKSDDRLLVFFSGHGQTVKLQNGGDMGFLIPFDAKIDLQHPDNRGPYLASCLPMDNLWGYLEGSPAKHSLLIADACFGGLLVRGRALTGERPSPSVVSTLVARPAQQALTAGGKNEEVQEDPRLGHGYLTYKLLEELKAQAANPDSVFLASQLASSLKTSVANLTNARQTPQFGSHNETEGDFVFVTTEPRQVPGLPAMPDKQHPIPPADVEHPEIKPRPQRQNVAAAPKINPTDHAEMVYVPGGAFTMGAKDVWDNLPHQVTLSGYYIYKNLVTVAQYRRFCSATGREFPIFPPPWGWKDNHPMVDVDWNDAQAYCKWAGVRLPTEAEWEMAARGTDGREYPWGNTFVRSNLQCSKRTFDDAKGTAPVGSFPSGASPYGALDMAGNVWQWCADWYDADYTKQANLTNPTGPAAGKDRILRGGSWHFFSSGVFRAANRFVLPPDVGGNVVGFRCVSQD